MKQRDDVRDEVDVAAPFTGGAYQPHVTVDCVIFGFHEGDLKVLVLQWKHVGKWSLPGGPVRTSQSLAEAASEVLEKRTGLTDVFLQQFAAFGGPHRGEGALRELFDAMGTDPGPLSWLTERVVSIGYYALVDFTKAEPRPDALSEDCRWCDVTDRPALEFDHEEMVCAALQTLRRQLVYEPVGLNLLPEKFTMPELRHLYETILGRALDRRNFSRKIKNLGIVERLGERRVGVAHRAPYLYRFDRARYERALDEGLAIGF